MRPQGHLAGGVIAGVLLATRQRGHSRAVTIFGTALAANAADLDIFIPGALNRIGVASGLKRGEHHAWPTHTPLAWALTTAALTLMARNRPTARGFRRMLTAGMAVHLAQDAASDALPLLWPVSSRHIGLRLDGIGTVDQSEFLRRYPGTPAWRLEWAFIIAASLLCLGRS